MNGPLHSDSRFPHPVACEQCRVLGLCNCCGRAAPTSTRCTNGHCVHCHQTVCTPGGITSPGHGAGLPEVREAAARGFQHTYRSITIGGEAIALDTCKQLVRRGSKFSVDRIDEGWRFTVERDDV
jgi:hypothetical protein